MITLQNICNLLKSQHEQGEYGDACHTRNRIADLTGFRLVDQGPIRGFEVDRSDEWPSGVYLLGDILGDSMDRIGVRVMRASFGDNGRTSDVEPVEESELDSGSRDRRHPSGVLERSIEAGNAEGRQELSPSPAPMRGSWCGCRRPQPGQTPYSSSRGPAFDGILP